MLLRVTWWLMYLKRLSALGRSNRSTATMLEAIIMYFLISTWVISQNHLNERLTNSTITKNTYPIR